MATTKKPPKPVSKAPPARITKALVDGQKKKAELQKLLAKLDQLKMRRQGVQEAKDMLDSVPERVYVQSWCVDATEEATGDVETIEINAEPGEILVAQGAMKPTPTSGAIVAREAQSGPQAYYNAAILPGVQKWLPTFRLATITALDYTTNKASIELLQARSDEQALPINLNTNIVGVPVLYMDCDSAAFKIGDVVVVKFQAQDWANPIIIGFRKEPRKCVQPLLFALYETNTAGGLTKATRTTIWGQATGEMQSGAGFVGQWARVYHKPFYWKGHGTWLGGFNNMELAYIQSAEAYAIKLHLPFTETLPPLPPIYESFYLKADIIYHPDGRTLLVWFCDRYKLHAAGLPTHIYDPYLHVFDLADAFTGSTIYPIASHRLRTITPSDEYDNIDLRQIQQAYLFTDHRQYVIMNGMGDRSFEVRDVITFELLTTHYANSSQRIIEADNGSMLYVEYGATTHYSRVDILTHETISQGRGPSHLETMIGNSVFGLTANDKTAKVTVLQLSESGMGSVLTTNDLPPEIYNALPSSPPPTVLLGK